MYLDCKGPEFDPILFILIAKQNTKRNRRHICIGGCTVCRKQSIFTDVHVFHIHLNNPLKMGTVVVDDEGGNKMPDTKQNWGPSFIPTCLTISIAFLFLHSETNPECSFGNRSGTFFNLRMRFSSAINTTPSFDRVLA